ncbi:RNA-directed DNA polymerase, eukaryota, reverse transcriptase zinc-binding domain protein [Tanacetum coccineum]
MLRVDLWMIRQVWGNSHFDFASTFARVVLLKGTPDHRPILLRENEADNGLLHPSSTLAKRRFLAIRGILKDGDWIDDPALVKSEFLSHFCKRFQQPPSTSTSFNFTFANPLSPIQSVHLERNCSREEIKKAVWDCGGDRAPGPDGFSFKFFTTFWDLVEDDVVRFANEFFASGSFPKGCNSTFITLILKVSNAKFVSDFHPISLIGCQYKIIGKILANRLSMVIGSCISAEQSAFIKGRNILGGPFILNEVLAWYHDRKKGLMVFKVDFEKAFDSVRWDFLDSVLERFGFGFKWRSWIHGCFSNACSSVLVNGSPTSKFDLHRGLRQGDPLSPFLFILAMEGLHALSCKAEELGLFKGASFGHDNMIVSHLMYADDVIFLGEWSETNAHNLICMLRCFFLISGLKINVHKSNVLGVGVFDMEVSNMAKLIGCGVAKFPLKYLGVPVGCNMARCSSWNAIIQKFSNKLSLWKTRLLSVGGRLTLLKDVLRNLPTYYMSIYMMPSHVQNKLESIHNSFFIGVDQGEKKITWIKWKKCMASKKLGGLGISSIYGLNIGLLFKWIWRFLSNPSDLWARSISNLYGSWRKGIDLLSFCSCSIGNGVKTKFWTDLWHGCPRGGVESSQFEALQAVLKDVVLSNQHDSWKWSLNVSSSFSVASVRQLVDSSLLVVDQIATRWNRCVPIKVNIFLWRLSLNKLPSRVNLDRKYIDVGSVLCPICQDDVESVNHIFFSCEMAKVFLGLLLDVDLRHPVFANLSRGKFLFLCMLLSKCARFLFKVVGGTLLWSIWNFRNRLVFSSSPPKKALLWDSIVSQSFLWISSRNPELKFSLLDWLQNPTMNISSM